MLFIISTIIQLVIIVLLLVIRNYQKKLQRAKEDTRVITKTINSFNPNDLEELNKNYQILIKILNNIQEDNKKEENEKYDKEIG